MVQPYFLENKKLNLNYYKTTIIFQISKSLLFMIAASYFTKQNIQHRFTFLVIKN
jgi:hypothetical protein